MKYFNNLKKKTEKIFSSPHRQFFLFFLSVVIIAIAKCFQFPILTVNAEMFGENGTNFFFHAFEDPLLTNLFIPDAGYLPWTQRFITLILVKGFHIIQFYPYVSQAIAILFIAVTSSLINFDIFKKLSSSTLARFIIGIAIGLISDFELNVYMNFIYYGGLLLFFGIIINKEKLSKVVLFFTSVVTAIILLSKGQFMAFVPIYFLLAFWHGRKKEYKSFIYFLSAIGAGLLQFSVMSSNTPDGYGPKLFLFPYYIVKSIYYLVLTYKHVFFGYVLKDGMMLISIGILFMLFIFALKTLISKKDKYTLYVFLAGNLIALCSLFITIVLYSQTNPNVQKIAAVVTTASTITSATEKVTSEVYENAQNTKNIFEVKHHANARGLFISNVLIFLVGIFVLLTLFSKKRDKIFFLLIIFFTSGAFGQVKVEEMYMQKSQSYSLWSTYYPLLQNERYCIPVNNYPFLIKKNCDYLLLKKENGSFVPTLKEPSILLSKFSPLAVNWEIQAVMFVNKPTQFTDTSVRTLLAYDNNEEIIGKAKQLGPTNYEYVYFLFDKPVSSVEKLAFKTLEGKDVIVSPNIIVFGTYTNGPHRKVEY
jgi:hypothetical protein